MTGPTSKLLSSRFVRSGFIEPRFPTKPAVGGGGGVTSLTFQASATSEDSTVTAPASIQAGDLLIAAQHVLNFAPPGAAVPSGFTQILTFQPSGSSLIRMTVSYKIADGSESGASLSGMSAFISQWIVMQFRGDAPISVATPADIGSAGADTNPAAQTVTSGGGTPPLVVIGMYASGSAVSPRTFTVGGVGAKDGEANPNTGFYMARKVFNSSPADVVVDMDDEGDDNMLASFYISVS